MNELNLSIIDKLIIYPNPAATEITIKNFESNIENIEIQNTLGQILSNHNISNNSSPGWYAGDALCEQQKCWNFFYGQITSSRYINDCVAYRRASLMI